MAARATTTTRIIQSGWWRSRWRTLVRRPAGVRFAVRRSCRAPPAGARRRGGSGRGSGGARFIGPSRYGSR